MDEGGDRVNRQRHSVGDELSDDHRPVVSDHSDNEDAAHRQPASRSGGRHGRGRPGISTRGWYGEMRQQHGDIVSDETERPRYSSVRGRGFRNDRGRQQQGRGPRVNERQDGSRDVEYRPDINRASGKQLVGYRQKYDDRQPPNARSGQSQEDWNEEIAISHSGKPVEQHQEQFRATTMQPAERKVSELRQSYGDRRMSDNVRSQRQEDKYVPTEPARRIHATRTISNRNYHTADNIPNRDRSSQIGGIVDAMKEISVKTAADDEAQRNVAPKSAMIVSGMHC